jgi:hypothetical protein
MGVQHLEFQPLPFGLGGDGFLHGHILCALRAKILFERTDRLNGDQGDRARGPGGARVLTLRVMGQRVGIAA